MARHDERESPASSASQSGSETAERLGISSRKVGLAPGSVVFTGTRHIERPIVSTITYMPEDVTEERDVDPGSLRLPTGTDA